MYSQKTCPFCGAQLTNVWKKGAFLKCSNCQLLIRNQEVDQQELDKLYERSWFDPLEKVSETGATTDDLADQYTALLANSLRRSNLKDLRIIDFGAGRGSMSFALSGAGADVTAIEPYGFEYLNQQGFQSFHQLNEVPDQNLYDGIVSLDVIEHLPSPWDDLKELRSRLVPGGWIFIATPNRDSLNARISKSNWREALRPGHLMLFNAFSLQKMLEEANFSKIRRLDWNVAYSDKPFIRAKDWILRLLQMDGELRFLAFNS
jgi:SAM-dependent methyltransferase